VFLALKTFLIAKSNQPAVLAESGEFVGLIGSNGAGKTALVKMHSGIIAPSMGEI
jgi:ABC-type multidrug transport system ATPase subunit